LSRHPRRHIATRGTKKKRVMLGSCSSFVSRPGVDGRDKRGHPRRKLVKPNSEPCVAIGYIDTLSASM